ncbi:hypothetical protein ACLOJK_031479 [Asimina triloba]
MSYVPPHLRNSSAPGALHDASSQTLEFNPSKLSSEASLPPSVSKPFSFSSAPRRTASLPCSRALPVPDPVFPQWKPSDRVFRLKPEQVSSQTPHFLYGSPQELESARVRKSFGLMAVGEVQLRHCSIERDAMLGTPVSGGEIQIVGPMALTFDWE